MTFYYHFIFFNWAVKVNGAIDWTESEGQNGREEWIMTALSHTLTIWQGRRGGLRRKRLGKKKEPGGCASPTVICFCKQRGSGTNTLPSSSFPDSSLPLGALREVAVSQLAGRDIRSNPFRPGSPQKFRFQKLRRRPSICRNENMKANVGTWRGRRGRTVSAATPTPLATPGWRSRGQEEASKLHENRRRVSQGFLERQLALEESAQEQNKSFLLLIESLYWLF